MPFVKMATKTADTSPDELRMSFGPREGGGMLCSVYVGNSDGSGQSTNVDVSSALTSAELNSLKAFLGKLRTAALAQLGYVQQ